MAAIRCISLCFPTARTVTRALRGSRIAHHTGGGAVRVGHRRGRPILREVPLARSHAGSARHGARTASHCWRVVNRSIRRSYTLVHRTRCRVIRSAVCWCVTHAPGSQTVASHGANRRVRSGWRWRRTSNYGAILHRWGGRRNVRPNIHSAERAVLRRLDPHRTGHVRPPQRGFREVASSAVDRSTVHKSVAIHGANGMHVVRVHKIDVTNVGVEDIRVADERVVHVDDGDEIMAAAEPREERFPEAERKPADSETKPATEEADKSRPIDGRPKERTGAPAPAAREIVPAAIVVRSKTPRRIIDPGPAPGADPIPIAIAVRSPVGRNFARVPNVAVFRFIAPVSIVVQIAVAGHVARNVLSGNGVVLFSVALSGPTIETVGTRSLVNAVLDVVRAAEFGTLARMNFVGFAASGNFAFAANHGHARRVAVFINVNAKSACFLDGESQIRSVYFVEIALPQFADTEVQTAFRKTHLRDALVKVQERKRGHTAEMHRGSASLQFGAGILIHPNLVADGHRAVFGGATPVALPAGLQGHGAIHVADARDARGRIFFIRSRLRHHKTQKTG